MATTDLRADLICSVCQGIYLDPVTLPCGHSFCLLCIEGTWNWQRRKKEFNSCPECRETYKTCPELRRNVTLRKIVEHYKYIKPNQNPVEIFCTYCATLVPAAKSCLPCEASLCVKHMKDHKKSAEHVFTKPTEYFGYRKCSVHKQTLEFYCPQEGACICAACCNTEKHNGHKEEKINIISIKKLVEIKCILKELLPEEVKATDRLQSRQKFEEKVTTETEKVTELFIETKRELEALEEKIKAEIAKLRVGLSNPTSSTTESLQIKRDTLSQKISQIEELCGMKDPLTLLHQWELHKDIFYCFLSDLQKDNEEVHGECEVSHLNGSSDLVSLMVAFLTNIKIVFRQTNECFQMREIYNGNGPADGEDVVSQAVVANFTGIVSSVKKAIHVQKVTDMVLDRNTAGFNVGVSQDGKTASRYGTDQGYLQTPERFKVPQVLSIMSFASGQHYWEVEGSESASWRVGVAYPSIERDKNDSLIGDNRKSWGLCRGHNVYSVKHASKVSVLSHVPSCGRIRISLDYEAGCLSFYELSEPIRHLHTFSATFTEPLHVAFCVSEWKMLGENAWVRIIH
ncbi:tripartite motif-containing protein 65 [Xenopus laevis]|uniref:Tripartite motif-containing protein 65 n=2 Tax=Xenopus laevis TaxID=8355 RepID=A0A1L8F559_XENLA|nr:tripartite motif-containing protein 65 [Xenopus laevis]OCT66699.1 hypothetical protein XELAEV_18042951mg [Xenopus laevis]